MVKFHFLRQLCFNGYYSIQTDKNITGAGLKNSSTKLYPKTSFYNGKRNSWSNFNFRL